VGRLQRFCFGALLVLSFTSLLPISGAEASTWAIPVASANSAEVEAAGPPAVPQGATATCALLAPNVILSWQSVAGASGYVVLESTTSASGPFNTVVGTTTGTGLTTGALPAGNYWFGIESRLGVNWVSPVSAGTVLSTIELNLVCVQL
jgi:hypothetical protein